MNGTERSSAGNSPVEAMSREAAEIAARHADILSEPDQLVKPLIVTIPAEITDRDLQVLVRHESDGTVLVDVRADTHSSWTPLCMVGGSFEQRAR